MRAFRLPAALLLAGVALAASAAGASTASAATATTRTETQVISFKATPSLITYGNSTVTFTGKLVEQADNSVGIASEPVSIAEQLPGAPISRVATVATGSDGSFTVTLPPLTSGADFWALFDGNSGYASTSAELKVETKPAPVKITLNPQPKSLVWAGTRLSFTGKVQVETPAKTWVPYAGATLLAFDTSAHEQVVTAKPDGTFTFSTTAAQSETWQLATILADPASSLYEEGATSHPVTVNVQYRTRILKFTVPARSEAHADIHVTGVVQVWNGSAWVGHAGITPAAYYRVLPSAKWIHANTGTTNGQGAFTINTYGNVVPGHLRWRIVVPRQGASNVYLASGSGTHDSLVYDHTCIPNFSADHFTALSRTDIAGFVQDWCGNPEWTFGTVTGTAQFYYHPRGTTKWTYLGSGKLGVSGSAVFTANRILHGYFKMVYPAHGYFLASTSKTFYLG
jgi:hypothetical protein